MKETRNWLIGVLILVGVIITVWYNVGQGKGLLTIGKQATCEGKVGPYKDHCAPDFTLSTLDGKQIKLSDNNGKPTILNFWASWCGPCQKEMPLLQSLYQKYQSKINFRMINVTAQDDAETVHQYILDHRYTFPVLLDPPDENYQSISVTNYKVRAIPVTIGISAEGKILYKKAGEMTERDLESLIGILEKSTR
ncbi:TlpA family protein disulfide reductase [Risungbinella massiliensis]|uniref:TlpA family protein disulfide reductase n=1 Tax=Risungbinella massiliensis TaxID=1329796 RepID=UPI00069A6F4A|nr:TlpA disulfide reductase family protein [Risungbinella massiliensis]